MGDLNEIYCEKVNTTVQRRLEKNVHWCIKTHAFLMDNLKPRLQEGQEPG